ncbi:MAG: type II toxin-antitoxin system RelE/ParE family toxin [Bacteroidota bacterium]
MTVVALSAQARADLRDALDYRALYSDEAAIRLADAFDQGMERLAQFPQGGSPREALGPEIRVLPLRSFRLNVFYHVLDGKETIQVLVLRVLREERDVGPDDIEVGW